MLVFQQKHINIIEQRNVNSIDNNIFIDVFNNTIFEAERDVFLKITI